MAMTLTVLGCSGSYPEPGNACSGYLVRSAQATTVVDFGPGTLANLQRHVALDQLDAIVLSHHHPDHWLDLPVLRNALRYYLGIEDLAVYGTEDLHELARTLSDPLAPTLSFTVVAEGSAVSVGDQDLRFERVDHPVHTLAVRIEAAGRSFAYSADTGSAWDAVDFVAGADLFVCEATLPPEHEDQVQHLTGRQAGKLAAAAGVGTLVLTHIAPGVSPEAQRDAARAEFDGPVELAQVGRTFTV